MLAMAVAEAHVFPRDSVGGTALRTRGRFSTLMRHPAGTIWRAHRDSTRAKEDYNTCAVFAPLFPSVLPTRADSDSKAETNFADFSIADEERLSSCDLREQFPRLFSTSNIYRKEPKWLRILLWFSYCTHDFSDFKDIKILIFLEITIWLYVCTYMRI